MTTEEQIIEQIKQQKLLPLFYHADERVCVETVKALYAAGIRSVEFTNRGDAALKNFKTIVAERNQGMKDLLLATGTIRNSRQANDFMDAGADFLISPVFDAGVCDAAYSNKILWIPGCATPTEIHVAEQAGCKLIKLFPGSLLGPSFVKSIKEIFPNINFMPTGGVEPTGENLNAWFAAGVCAVGMGGHLISKERQDNKDYSGITKRVKQVLDMLK
ncbi:MAG: bifunctional 4-hydroxy-2-oxoglutarate aldolase/2-dehydro-3-deoxy-phosphogluconate aldolase [Ferruginibacter sp.]